MVNVYIAGVIVTVQTSDCGPSLWAAGVTACRTCWRRRLGMYCVLYCNVLYCTVLYCTVQLLILSDNDAIAKLEHLLFGLNRQGPYKVEKELSLRSL